MMMIEEEITISDFSSHIYGISYGPLPSGGIPPGTLWFNSIDDKLYLFNGSNWNIN